MTENCDKRGGLGMVYDVRFCCGKSVRAPRFYFAGRSGIIDSDDDG